MRVAVLGAGGTIAPAIVRDLADSAEAESLLLLDIDRDRAERVGKAHGGEKAEARAADATHGLAAELAGIDLLVNSASYRINLAAMHACLEAGCHYMDLGGLYHVTAEQLKLSDRFRRSELLALLGIGSAPGKTNLMARRAARELAGGDGTHDDAPLERIDIAAAGRDLDPPEGISFPYAVGTLLDELTMSPMIIAGGEPREIRPMQPGGAVDFGEPIGTAETIYTLHSEILTLGHSFGCDSATFRLSLPERVLDDLRELVGASAEHVAAVARSAAPPSPRTVAVHLVEATRDGEMVSIRSVTPPHEEWGLGGGIVSTASTAAAAVRLLARGRIEARGALPPERALESDEMFSELESRGVRVEVTHAREAAVR